VAKVGRSNQDRTVSPKAAVHSCINKRYIYLFIHFHYLFVNSIPKSIYRSSPNGYRYSQRISNLAVCNREPVTKIGSLAGTLSRL